ncbi:Cof-type HAD-IIB family hydrolase [Oceanobacillus senegalensis]|uniref:Cof-type HAD-IIB family hydrolase n=1 Tax=Oceanobacillus senegalensis TaxID=1936063 RepID=UPI000A307334|nr:Cof-type HAD-IIB family hydrolase [Oceanobacillus senegalensis]
MKLFALDMDGTLLSSDGTISEANHSMMKKAQSQGHMVVIASGRSIHDTIQILKEAELNCPIIAGNGAIVFHEGNMLRNLYLSPERVEEIISLAQEIDVYFELYTNQGVFIEECGRNFLIEEARNQREKDPHNFLWDRAERIIEGQFLQKGIQIIPSYLNLDYEKLEIYKVFVLSFHSDKLMKLEEILRDRHDLSITTSGKEKLEIGHPKTSKGNALKFLANYLQIPLEHTITFGDNLNDLSMFHVSGTSVAMGNAEDIVKKEADFVTKHHDENGVAFGMGRFLS